MAQIVARCLAGLLAAASVTGARADPVADFYKGRTVSLIVSTSVGGGYDILGRAVSRFLGRHVPGNPTVIVRNMAGAGGIVATNFLYNQAEQDGTNIGLLQDNAPFKPLLGTKEARYDPTELNCQGPDTGTQYRSEVFAASPDQARIAKAYIAELNQAHAFDAAIVTKIEPLKGFYPAEAYHQDFLVRNPTYPYIVINDLPKVAALKRLFPDQYRPDPVLVGSR